MLDPNISDQEKACLRILAKLFLDGKTLIRSPLPELQSEGLEVNSESLDSLLGMMEHYGGIVHGEPTNAQRYRMLTITAASVQLVRELDGIEEKQKEPGDIVEKIQKSARQSSTVAWIIIGFFVLTAAATLVNQTIQIVQNLGWMAKP